MEDGEDVIEWLLEQDPAIRWQTLRDLADAPESAWQPERARVETEGWGAQFFAHQDADGLWAGGVFVPGGFTRAQWQAEGQPWTATSYCLAMLREMGLDPQSEAARRTVDLVGRNGRWDEGAQSYWSGETEECINGRTLADGAYFGVDMSELADRLLGERQPDGGWNCERANGSERSSFASTINVLEGLLEYQAAASPDEAARVVEARRHGEEFLLERHLFRRLSTGEVADPDFLRLGHPNRWTYDILRALDYFRSASAVDATPPDPRLGEAIGHLEQRRSEDGRWPLDWTPRGRTWFPVDPPVGEPSPWITLRALRVLRWWGSAPPAR